MPQTNQTETVWREVKDYFFITLGLLLYTFGWTVFLLPYQIVTGGVTGIAAIIYYASKIPSLILISSSTECCFSRR